MKICVAGQGAFGIKHLEAIANIDGIEVVSLAGGNLAGTEEVAKRFGIPALDDRSRRKPCATWRGSRDSDHAHPDARRSGRSSACAPASTS